MSSSFPSTTEELHTHYAVVVPRINAEKVRLQIDAGKVSALNTAYGDDVTDNTYIYIYNKWADITTRTEPITTKLNNLEKTVKNIIMNIFNNIPADLWNDDDRAIFRRKTGLPKEKPVHHHTPIQEDVFFKIIANENAEFEFICRKTEDATRASLPKGATGVEVIYDIREYKQQEGQPELSSIPKRLPTNIKECPFKEIFTKSKFTLKLDPENVGKYIVVYVRWINLKHPEAAGNYSGPQAADIR